MTTSVAFEVRPASPRIGAEIVGVDLKADVDADTAEQLRQALHDYKVLVFRDQQLSPAQQVYAVSIFGEVFDHPTAIRHAENALVYPYRVEQSQNATADRWHVGGLWRNPPFTLESLVFEEVAELGGNTLWADLQAAYDDLSEPVKRLLEEVAAVYDAHPEHYAQGSERGPVTRTVEHAVVRVDPATGRKGLFISSSAQRLTGVTQAESEVLLPFLLRHASSPDYSVRFGWAPGDFVVWDNLATWHRAVYDYGEGTRAYRKVLAAGPEN